MRELKKWLTKLISRMMPTQTASGSEAIQIGKMDGNVTHVHLTQHIYGDASASQRLASKAPPIRVSRPDRRYKQRPLPADQHIVLDILDQVPDRIAVLDFMAGEFGTSMVIELDAHQLYRLRRYIEVILSAQVRN